MQRSRVCLSNRYTRFLAELIGPSLLILVVVVVKRVSHVFIKGQLLYSPLVLYLNE